MNAFGKFGNSNWEMPGAACSSSQKFTLGLCVWCSGTGYLIGIHSLSPRLHDPESHGNVSHGPVFPLPAPPSVCLSESNPGANAPSALFTILTHQQWFTIKRERKLLSLSSSGWVLGASDGEFKSSNLERIFWIRMEWKVVPGGQFWNIPTAF